MGVCYDSLYLKTEKGYILMLNKKHLTSMVLLAILSFSVACEQKAEQSVIVNITPEGKVLKPNERPVNPNEEPVNPNEEPVNPDEEPVNPDERPVNPDERPDSVDVKEEIKDVIKENAAAINSQNLSTLLATLHPLSPLKPVFEKLGSQVFAGGTRQQILSVTNILHDEKTATAQVSRKVSDNFGIVLEKTSFSLEVSDGQWLIMNVAIHSQEQSF